jgi:DNA-binding response OmpR family regulator
MNLDQSVLSQAPARRATLKSRFQRVLVAEDDAETRDLVVTAFAAEGHDVFGLRGEAELVECLDIIARHSLRSPDLIAIGVSMAWHSGIDLVENVRSAGWTTPLVLMTWSMRGDLRSRVEVVGSAVVVAKPIRVAELRGAARRARTK